MKVTVGAVTYQPPLPFGAAGDTWCETVGGAGGGRSNESIVCQSAWITGWKFQFGWSGLGSKEVSRCHTAGKVGDEELVPGA